jgi:hypothetical protein
MYVVSQAPVLQKVSLRFDIYGHFCVSNLRPSDEIVCAAVKWLGDRVKRILTALAASEKGEIAISFNISLAGSLSEKAVPDILMVDTDNSKATSRAGVGAYEVYQLPYCSENL